MKSMKLVALTLAIPFAIASAQQQVASTNTVKSPCCDTLVQVKDSSAGGVVSLASLVPQIVMQNFRPADQRGVGMFEAPKASGVPFTGFRWTLGAAFRQSFQGLEHSNKATPVMSGTTNTNQLIDIGRGFNLASANLNLNMQLSEGVRVALTSYLSSRHHQETWVKDGYALIDKSPIDNPILNTIMKYTTLKLGHFEINYGDQHFRRTDNGNGIYNPFVGNYIIDAFTTEVGGEAYFRAGGVIAMAGLTSGTIQGGVTTPAARSNAYLGKLGVDKQVLPELRIRTMTSYYKNDKSPSNTLLTGDRAGSPYMLVMENTAATTSANAWSAGIRPGFSNTVRAMGVNQFIRFHDTEFFGTAENFRGKALSEKGWQRDWNQWAADVVQRAWNDKVFVGARVNTANGKLVGIANKVSTDRYAASAGWFVTPTMLLKGEFMNQRYNRFPTNDIRNGGKIQGFMVEGIVSF